MGQQMNKNIVTLAKELANGARAQGSEVPDEKDYAMLRQLLMCEPSRRIKKVFDEAFRDQARENGHDPIGKYGHEWPK